MITPIVLYGAEVWGPSSRAANWAIVERILVSMLSLPIQSKRMIPHLIKLPKFNSLVDPERDAIRLPSKALDSLIDLTTQGCCWCWFLEVSEALQIFDFLHDRLPTPQEGLPRSSKDLLIAI